MDVNEILARGRKILQETQKPSLPTGSEGAGSLMSEGRKVNLDTREFLFSWHRIKSSPYSEHLPERRVHHLQKPLSILKIEHVFPPVGVLENGEWEKWALEKQVKSITTWVIIHDHLVTGACFATSKCYRFVFDDQQEVG